jgi:hypothetical protein
MNGIEPVDGHIEAFAVELIYPIMPQLEIDDPK